MARKSRGRSTPPAPSFGGGNPGTVPVQGARPTVPLPGAAATKPNFDAIMGQAAQHHQAGRLDHAAAGYQQVLNVIPRHPHALHLMGVIHMQKGDHESAIELLERAIGAANDNADFHADLGVALMSVGRSEDGLAHFRRAADLRPKSASDHYNVGLALVQLENLNEAAESFRRTVRLDPLLADAHMNLGLILLRQDMGEEAVQCLRKAVDLGPDNVVALTNLGTGLVGNGSAMDAIPILEKAVALDPSYSIGHFSLGNAHEEANSGDQSIGGLIVAERHYRRALELNPRYFEATLNLGNILKFLGRLEEAEYQFRLGLDIRPDQSECLNNLAEVLVDQDRDDEAMDLFQSIRGSGPQFLSVYHRLAHLWQSKGEFERGREVIEELRNIEPDSPIIFTTFSMDQSHRFDDAELVRVQSLADKRSLPDSEQFSLDFALARYLDTVSEYDRAFPHLRRANEIVDANDKYDVAEEETFLKTIEDVLDASFFAGEAIGSDSDQPIFIVGMPRSGTTLVEQIIASHPQTEGGGELETMTVMSKELAHIAGPSQSYPRCLVDLDGGTVRDLYVRYLGCLERVSPDAVRVTDKMPGNYHHLGLIARLFPNSRIVYCRRAPLDNCISLYFQKFSGYHPYAYDLQKLARYYALHERIMTHWRRVVPLPVHEIVYEDLIADQEKHSRDLIDFCGLEWDDQCLRFFDTARKVNTASMWQVRQPIYDSSVGRWRNYERHLGPLIDGLTAAGVSI